MRLTDKRLTLMALDAAIQWESELRDGSPAENAKNSQKIIDGYRRVLKRLTNGTVTISEMAYARDVQGARKVGIKEIREMADRGEIQVHKMEDQS